MRSLLCTVVLLMAAGIAQAADVSSFELRWMNHEDRTTMYKSSDHPNGIFVVETYFLGCPYCNDNASAVDALAADYADQERVQVVDVSRDCRDIDYNEWIRRHNPNHPVLNDCSRKLIGALGTRSYPTTYILDCTGKVVYQSVGAWNSNTKRAIRAKIDQLLQQDCSALGF